MTISKRPPLRLPTPLEAAELAVLVPLALVTAPAAFLSVGVFCLAMWGPPRLSGEER